MPAGSSGSRSARSWYSPAGHLVPLPLLGELIDLQRSMEVFASAGTRKVAAAQWPHPVPQAHRRLDRVLGRRGKPDHREPADDRQSRSSGQEARRAGQAQQRASAVRQPECRGARASRHGPRGAQGRSGDARRDGRHADQGTDHLLRHQHPHRRHDAPTATPSRPPMSRCMDSKLPDAVDAPTAWVMRKAMFAALMNRRADAVSLADGKGPFLLRGPTQTPSPCPASFMAPAWCAGRSRSPSEGRRHGPHLHPARLLPGLGGGADGRDGVPGVGSRRHRPSERPDRGGIQHIDAGPRARPRASCCATS